MLNKLILGFLPAVLIVMLTAYFINENSNEPKGKVVLPGKPLAAYPDLYPIKVADGHLALDKDVFMKAVDHFVENPKVSLKAAADLIYLGQGNNVNLLLNSDEQARYRKLLDNEIYDDLKELSQHKDRLFDVYKDIVNGIGKTFEGTNTEIVLHDTRNPLQSVVAIQNPISGRRLGDSTTNFGIELIKDYSILANRGGSYISYGLTLKDGRKIKSSTIPLFDDSYGLIGFICLNIDISKLAEEPANIEYQTQFLESFIAVSGNKKIDELIDNSRKN